MYGEVFDLRRAQFVSLNMTCSPSLVSLTMTCNPYLKTSNIFIHDAC